MPPRREDLLHPKSAFQKKFDNFIQWIKDCLPLCCQCVEENVEDGVEAAGHFFGGEAGARIGHRIGEGLATAIGYLGEPIARFAIDHIQNFENPIPQDHPIARNIANRAETITDNILEGARLTASTMVHYTLGQVQPHSAAAIQVVINRLNTMAEREVDHFISERELDLIHLSDNLANAPQVIMNGIRSIPNSIHNAAQYLRDRIEPEEEIRVVFHEIEEHLPMPNFHYEEPEYILPPQIQINREIPAIMSDPDELLNNDLILGAEIEEPQSLDEEALEEVYEDMADNLHHLEDIGASILHWGVATVTPLIGMLIHHHTDKQI